MILKSFKNKSLKGFSLLELIVVMAMIGILSTSITALFSKTTKSSYDSRAAAEFKTIDTAARLHYNEAGTWAPDVNRDIPATLKSYIGANDKWPKAPWPGSVYDWDNYMNNGQQTVQISIRFCPAGGPLSACSFPNEDWASGFLVNSSYYYCIQGPCKPHPNEAANYPGRCANCVSQ